MGRIYKRKPQKYDDDALSNALKSIREKRLSISKAVKEYNIDRSLLSRRLHGKGIKKRGRKTEFQSHEEEKLATCLRKLSQWGFGLMKEEVLNVVQEYIKKNDIKTKFHDGQLGKDWLDNFMKRQNLSLKKPEQLQSIRRNATSDPFIIYDFYDVLEATLKQLDLFDKPTHIFNLDETSFSYDPSGLKVVGEKGKSVHRTIQSSGKQNTTVLACVNAAGRLLLPLIIHQGNNTN